MLEAKPHFLFEKIYYFGCTFRDTKNDSEEDTLRMVWKVRNEFDLEKLSGQLGESLARL